MASETTAIQQQVVRGVRAGFVSLTLLSFGHFFIDLYSMALGTLQPLIVSKLQLSLTQAGILGGLLLCSSSVLQPVYGYLSDRFHTRMFTVLAPAVAGIFMSSIGAAPTFGWLLALVALGGAGIASFHPQASARATLGLDTNRQRWFAVFISAGTLGMALGPTVFSTALPLIGLDRSYWFAIPGVLATVMLLLLMPELEADSPHRRNRFNLAPLKAVWKPLTILYFLVFIRSIVQVTYAQFLALYLTHERGYSFAQASWGLSIYLTAGALGGFVGGHLADRFGGRRVILISMMGCVPFLATFFLATGALSLAGLALGGLFLLFTIPVNVVMAQDLVPSQAGTISALMMGFAWGMSGLLFIPLTGWAADHYSLHTTLMALTIFPIVGFFLTLKLPKR